MKEHCGSRFYQQHGRRCLLIIWMIVFVLKDTIAEIVSFFHKTHN